MRRNSSNTDPVDPYVIEKIMIWDCEMWYSYVISGLRNELEGSTRKSQRTCQRRFCACYSRLQRFRTEYTELFI